MSDAGQGRRRAQRTDPAIRRAQILDAAVEVFGRQGYRQGSLKDVAAATGISQQGILHHFGSKEGLLRATLDHRNRIRSETFDRVAREEGVLALCRLILSENLARTGFMRLFVTLSAEATDPEHPAHEHFVRRYASLHERLAELYRADAAGGRVAASVPPEEAATRLIALSDGLQLQFLLRPGLDVLAAFDAAVAELRA